MSPTGVQTSQGRSESTRSRCRECGELEGGKIKADPRSLMQGTCGWEAGLKCPARSMRNCYSLLLFCFPFIWFGQERQQFNDAFLSSATLVIQGRRWRRAAGGEARVLATTGSGRLGFFNREPASWPGTCRMRGAQCHQCLGPGRSPQGLFPNQMRWRKTLRPRGQSSGIQRLAVETLPPV